MKYDVTIMTGWSNMGGSTESYINLTNALNAEGINTILVGPNQWHLNKCKSGTFQDISGLTTKNIIWHFLRIDPNNEFPLLYKANSILSCHETIVNPVFNRYNPQIAKGMFDYYHFVSDHQLDWQVKYSGIRKKDNMVVIPNILDPTLARTSPTGGKKIGGVIGSIDGNKQIHVSIRNALSDGCDLVRVFGHISDPNYYDHYVRPLISNPKVVWHGVVEDKNKIYSSITDVYHNSKNETWGYIQAECKLLNIPFHSTIDNNVNIVSTSTLVAQWKGILTL